MKKTSQILSDANRLLRDHKYLQAIDIYKLILQRPLPQALAESIGFNIRIAERNSQSHEIRRCHVGKQLVSNIDAALGDMEACNKSVKLLPGLTALIRAKNAKRFIRSSIETIADLVDEVIAVDNNSTDGTIEVMRELQDRHKNVKVYQYNIDLPRVGAEHECAINEGSQNTLGTFYNWCLAKVTRYNVLKWDADFIASRRNIAQMIDQYNLRTTSENLAVWCTGVTAYYGKIFNLESYYDEYRVFSKLHGAKWENWRGCETLTPSISRTPQLYVFPEVFNVKRFEKESIQLYKYNSPPVFFEIKDFYNLKPPYMIIDKRDKIDNDLINEYQNVSADYRLPDILNRHRVLIILPNLKVGGGNFWAIHVYNSLRYIGVDVHIGASDVDPELIDKKATGRFGSIDRKDLVLLKKDALEESFNLYTNIIITTPIFYNTSSVNSHLVAFTHSEISYFNDFILQQGIPAISLNKATINKMRSAGVECELVKNYIPKATRTSLRSEDKNLKILYCNRISDDKNLIMLLVAFARLLSDKVWKKITLTILAGGSNELSFEYKTILGAVRALGIGENVEVLPSQNEVEPYYLDHDLVVLPSVSEGCSLGLLEAINYEVPILSTDITANTEVTKGRLPHFTIEGLRDKIENIFAVDSKSLYMPLLELAGYVSMNTVFSLSKNGSLNYAIIGEYLGFLDMQIEPNRANLKTLCPLFISDLINKDANTSSELNSYLNSQRSVFEHNADLLASALSSSLQKISSLRDQVKSLKRLIEPEYFSKRNYCAQLANALFQEKLSFITKSSN